VFELLRLHHKVRSKFFVFLFVMLLAAPIMPFYSLFAAFPVVKAAKEPLSLKWAVTPGNASTMYGALAAKLIPGSEGLQLVITGGSDPITEDQTAQGDVLALSGITGEVLWRASGYHMGTHNPFQIVDLDADNDNEIVIADWNQTIALNGEDGSLFWKVDARSDDLLPVYADVDGDGYPEVFVSSGNGPYEGSDWISMISHDGNILRQAYSWHPCFGGLAIGDTNGDGRYELYQSDRPIGYSEPDDPNEGGGLGLRALDAATLTPLWNYPYPLSNSHAPILVDVDLDGVLDIVASDQEANGTVVLNSQDGSVLTTSLPTKFVYRNSWTDMASHSQPTVADLNGDRYPEIISCDFSQVKIWDLYNWKPLASLYDEKGNPLIAQEPPKAAHVVDGPYLNIIAAADPDDTNPYDNQRFFLYIYEYNDRTGKFDIFQQVPVDNENEWDNCRNFSLVADVDGDGLNELVLTSTGGKVWCYDTSVSSNPGIRSDVQFYSQMNRGAGEAVSYPVHSGPVIADATPKDGVFGVDFNPTLSIEVIDYQRNKIDVSFSLYRSGNWQLLGPPNEVSPGLYCVDTAGIDKPGATYRWRIQISDGVTPVVKKEYTFTTRSSDPTQGVPELVSSNGTLICSAVNTTDADGDELANIYTWSINGEPYASLHMPFDTRTSTNPFVTEQVFFDGFEDGLSNWTVMSDANWDSSTDQRYSGSYSVHASAGDSTLTSHNLDTSNIESLIISFWYRNRGVTTMNLQLWDGLTYKTIVNLGASKPDDSWHHYTLQTFDPRFLATDFRVRFSPKFIGQGQEFWVDDFGVSRSSSVKDYSGLSNHGTIHGATWISDGLVGGAYSFDGVNDYIYVPDAPSLGGEGDFNELGIEFWVNPSKYENDARLIVKKVPSQNNGSYMVGFHPLDSARSTLFFGITSTVDGQWHEVSDPDTTSIQTGVWSHVVCTYKSGEGLSIYINGDLRTNSPLAGAVGLGPESPSSIYGRPVFIGFDGSWNDYSWFTGSLDEVTIYPRALSSSQVLQRYVETKDGLSENSTMTADETRNSGTWICKVTPNDSFGDGETYASSMDLSQSPTTPTSPNSNSDSNQKDNIPAPKTDPSPSPVPEDQNRPSPTPENPDADKEFDDSGRDFTYKVAAFAVVLIIIATVMAGMFFVVRRK
jgi:hypothetical protein